MTEVIKRIGQVMFCKEGDREAFTQIISKLDLRPPVIVKPNWSTSTLFTEAEILDWTLSAIDCEKIVVESYAHYRSPIFRDFEGPFTIELQKRLDGQKKIDLRENDQWFLELSGIGDILKKHGVEYLNLSEELWSKRVCAPVEIRKAVESHFSPVKSEILLSMVPTRLYDMRGGTLLSLAKPKLAHGTIGITLSVKNLFGMIATPYRGKFHGADDSKLNDSIVDINKICHALFNVRGLIEAVFTTSGSEDFLGKSNVHHDLGLIWGSDNIFELDVAITTQLGFGVQDVGHLALAAQTFDQMPQVTIESAKKHPISLSKK